MEEDIRQMWANAGHLYRGAADLIYRTNTGKSIDYPTSGPITRAAPSDPVVPRARA